MYFKINKLYTLSIQAWIFYFGYWKNKPPLPTSSRGKGQAEKTSN